MAIPHVSDEVAIGFEHGDVRRPIILGALFNGVDKPGADLVKDTSSVAARFPRDLDIATKKKTLLTGTEDITVKSETGTFDARRAGKDIKLASQERHDHDRGERRPDQGDRQGRRRDQRQRPAEDHLDGARDGRVQRRAAAQGLGHPGPGLRRPAALRRHGDDRMSAQLGSGLAFPLGVDQRGAIALATGETDIEQAIAIILSTSPGERPMRPEFGCAVHEHVFDVLDPAAFGAIESAVRAAIERWEPRASVQAIDFDLDQQSEGCLNIVLTYEIPDVPGVRNLVHPFYIIPEEEGPEGEVVDAEVVAW